MFRNVRHTLTSWPYQRDMFPHLTERQPAVTVVVAALTNISMHR